MSYSKLTTWEGIALVLVIITNHLVTNMPQSILKLCGSSSILNILFISVIAFFLTLVIVKLFQHFTNSDIIDVSHYLGGKWLQTILGILLILYLLLITSTLLRNFSEGLKIAYLEKAPIYLILLFFLVVCFIANRLGERVIIKTNVIISFLILISLVITFLSTIPNITVQRIFPILGYGVNQTFFSGLSNLFAFNSLLYLFFLMPMLEKKENFKKVSLISFFITSLLLLLAIGSLLLSFSFIQSVEELSPVYLIVTNTSFGRFFQRPESLFILTWILSLMTYLNVAVLFILKILRKITKIKSSKPFILPVTLAILVVSLLPSNMASIRWMENVFYKYSTLFITFLLCFVILIAANIKHYYKNRKQKKEEN